MSGLIACRSMPLNAGRVPGYGISATLDQGLMAAADFGKELTTAVMWLIDRGINIHCVRTKP